MSKHNEERRARRRPEGGAGKGASPASDLELMRWLDEDLDEAGIGAVLARDPAARRKRRDLEIVGDLLRDRAASDARADGIADAVMAAISKEPARAKAPVEAPAQAPSELVRLADKRLEKVARPRAANDNARSIFALAALAAAAAAGLFFWGRGGPGAGPSVASTEMPAAVAELTGAPATVSPATGRVDKEAAPVVAKREVAHHAVEVAAVDFGSRSGSVFYMPGNGSEADDGMTAVVWVNDDSAGGRP